MRHDVCHQCLRPRDCVTSLVDLQPICHRCAFRLAIPTTHDDDGDDWREWAS
jgi:hypothetical protein